MDIISREILIAFIGWFVIWLALWAGSALVASHSYQAAAGAIIAAPVVDERDV